MDTALELRLRFEQGEHLSKEDIWMLLNESKLVKKLVNHEIEDRLFAIFCCMGLSEIPYSKILSFTEKLLTYINKNLATEEGFSYLGGIKEIVPCYNAMLLEAYVRLDCKDSVQVQNALNWIKKYQLFERNQKSSWPYDGVCKHGGCLKSTPCYIGIGKTVRALITYAEYTGHQDSEVEQLIRTGTEYMVRHKMYKRLSNDQPISAHITDIMFPQSYALSFTDLVYIAGKTQLQERPELREFFETLNEKQADKNKWKIDYVYKFRGYVPFETRRNASLWVSNLFSKWLNLQ